MRPDPRVPYADAHRFSNSSTAAQHRSIKRKNLPPRMLVVWANTYCYCYC